MTTTINYSKRSDMLHTDYHILQNINNDTYYKVDVVPYGNKWRYLVSGKIRSFNFSGYLGTIYYSDTLGSKTKTTTIEVDNYNNNLDNIYFTEDMRMVEINKNTNIIKPYIIHINPDVFVQNIEGVHIILDTDRLNVEKIKFYQNEPFYCISVGLPGISQNSIKKVFSYNLITNHVKEEEAGKYVNQECDMISGQVCNIYKNIDGKTYYLIPKTNIFYNNTIVEPLVRYDNNVLYGYTQNNNTDVGNGGADKDNEGEDVDEDPV